MTTRRAPKPLTKLDPAKTAQHRNFSRPGSQKWGAVSADGKWTYKRLEEAGTPWIVLDADGDEWGTGFGTLARARAATAKHDTEAPPRPEGHDVTGREAFLVDRAEWYRTTQGTDRRLSAVLAEADWAAGITDPALDHVATSTSRKDTT